MREHQAPSFAMPEAPLEPARLEVLLLSAPTRDRLEQATEVLCERLDGSNEQFAALAQETRCHAPPLEHRRAVVAESAADAADSLRTLDPTTTCTHHARRGCHVAFLFPGVATQYPGMGRELYQTEPAFRAAMDRCFAIARRHSPSSFAQHLYGEGASPAERAATLEQPSVALPCLFMIEYALAQAWLARGVRPHAMLGQSLGEYAAACLADVFSLEDALSLTIYRGTLFDELPPGLMLRISACEEVVRPILPASVDLAVVSSSESCVIAGATQDIIHAEQFLSSQFPCQRLRVRGAGHSRLVEPIMARLQERIASLRLQPPRIPYVSSLTGRWVTGSEACSPTYWAAQMRRPVQLRDGLALLLEQEHRVTVELGPHGLTKLIPTSGCPRAPAAALASMRHPHDPRSDREVMLRALSEAWSIGVDVNW